MNSIEIKTTKYFRPSRTLETLLVSNINSGKVYYIYNYEGISYSVFKNYEEVLSFFQEKSESDYHFDNEADLDNFLLRIIHKELDDF